MRASRRPEVGCHRGKLRLRENRRNFSKTPDIGSCPARGEGSNPSSRSDLSGTVRLRQNHANYKGKPSSTPVDPIPSSRQYPNESGSIRPPTATHPCQSAVTTDPRPGRRGGCMARAARGDQGRHHGDGQGRSMTEPWQTTPRR